MTNPLWQLTHGPQVDVVGGEVLCFDGAFAGRVRYDGAPQPGMPLGAGEADDVSFFWCARSFGSSSFACEIVRRRETLIFLIAPRDPVLWHTWPFTRAVVADFATAEEAASFCERLVACEAPELWSVQKPEPGTFLHAVGPHLAGVVGADLVVDGARVGHGAVSSACRAFARWLVERLEEGLVPRALQHSAAHALDKADHFSLSLELQRAAKRAKKKATAAKKKATLARKSENGSAMR